MEERTRKPSTTGQTVSLARKMLRKLFGLDDKAITDVVRQLGKSGRPMTMLKHFQTLESGTVNVIIKNMDKLKKVKGGSSDNDEEESQERDADTTDTQRLSDKKKKEVKEGKLTFMSHLLNEVGTEAMDDSGAVTMDVNPEDLRDPDKKRAAMLQQRKNKSKPQKEREIRLKIKELQDRLKAMRSGGDAGGL